MNRVFHDDQRVQQVHWRDKYLAIKGFGYQNRNQYAHIVPKKDWEQTLWTGIRTELPIYLQENQIQSHTGTHNLLSSWVLCANLYFPVRIYPQFKMLMQEFLQNRISAVIVEVTAVELEFAFEGGLSPADLLGEQGGSRGSGQTSPDVAFLVRTKQGEGIILTECKYTEHSFYPCSARTTRDSEMRKHNPDPRRCMNPANACTYETICHQKKWGRKYWEHLEMSEVGKATLKRCPASTSGYQLLRQHSLANGIAKSDKFSLVMSCVAYDSRNEDLRNCLRTTGINDFSKDWAGMFVGEAKFNTWTHQDWVAFVRARRLQDDWTSYMKERYGL